MTFPLVMAVSIVVLILVMLVIMLPIAVVLYGVSGDWGSAALALLGWLSSFVLFRSAWRRWLSNAARHEYGSL